MNIQKIQEDINRQAEYFMMTKLPPNELSTDKIPVIGALFGENPASAMYGKIIGYFQYQDKVYEFWYHVHKPRQKYPHLSNHMTELYEVVKRETRYGSWYDKINTSFGNMAFWDYTPLSYLEQQNQTDAYELRKLMMKITEYSRKQKLCKKLRKTDKQAILQNPLYQNKE